ncbi:hypothetical protein BDV18DRAFT_138605 [Aspergillus unguis]
MRLLNWRRIFNGPRASGSRCSDSIDCLRSAALLSGSRPTLPRGHTLYSLLRLSTVDLSTVELFENAVHHSLFDS